MWCVLYFTTDQATLLQVNLITDFLLFIYFFKVPNIRFNVAKELRSIAMVCGANSYEPIIMPILNMLAEDDDRDVRYNAELSLNALDEAFATITK